MVCLTYCHACQFGMHDDHIKDFAPAPPGVMGGFMCPCEGECVDDYKPSPIVEGLAQFYAGEDPISEVLRGLE